MCLFNRVILFSAIYITFVMILAALSLFCTVLVLMFHHHHCGVEPPAWLQTLVFKVLSKLLCTRIQPENGVTSGLDVISSRSQSTRANEEGRIETSPELSGRMAIYAVNDRPEARDFQVCKMAQKFQNRPAENRTSEQLEFGLAQRKRFETAESDTIASAIEFFQRSSAKCRTEEEESHTKQKWTEMARVCDRLFLVIFFVATFTICILLFGVLPRFGPTNVEPVDIS